ncbi:hypothetical protein SpCBS45565_g03205 [Spizellomyces sp. 'palustris']|nr:hypothetical protein SpCBS45565_g03205 [Spizellomyces sp. 'palustris']
MLGLEKSTLDRSSPFAALTSFATAVSNSDKNDKRPPTSIIQGGRRSFRQMGKASGGGGPPAGTPSSILKRLRRPGCLRGVICIALICFVAYTVLLSGPAGRGYRDVIRATTSPSAGPPAVQHQNDPEDHTFPTGQVSIHERPDDRSSYHDVEAGRSEEPRLVPGRGNSRLPAAKLPDPITGSADTSNPVVPPPDSDPSRRPMSRPDGLRAGLFPGKNSNETIAYLLEQYDALKRNLQKEIENAVKADRERRQNEQKQLVEAELAQHIGVERQTIEKEYEKKLASELERVNADKQQADKTVKAELDRIFTIQESSDPSSRIFNPDLALKMYATKEVRLAGFKWCKTLEGADFNAWVHIAPLGGNLITANPSRLLAANMIDTLARKVYDNVMSWAEHESFDPTSVRRFACYMAAHGKNEYALATDGMWLLHVNGTAYFPELTLEGPGNTPVSGQKQLGGGHIRRAAVPTGKQDNAALQDDYKDKEDSKADDKKASNNALAPTDTSSSALKFIKNRSDPPPKQRHSAPTTPLPNRRRYKIAYLLLVHERLDVFSTLFDALYDQDGVFLIHVDAKRSDFRAEVHKWLITHKVYANSDNIFVMENSFNMNWGASSIVFGQLQGFFTLMDLADWDYVINLSGYDYPVRSSKAIHAILERDPGKAYIEHWYDSEIEWRLERPFFLTRSRTSVRTPSTAPERRFPLDHRFRSIKHHQWMILPRAFVQYLRSSQDAHDLLAWSEHSWIPDESYFGMVALAKSSAEGGWSDKVINDCKRFIYFEKGALHPIWLKNGDEGKLEPGGKVEVSLPLNSTQLADASKRPREFFFVRKINSLWEKGIRQWMDDRRREVDGALKEEIEAVDKKFWDGEGSDYSVY